MLVFYRLIPIYIMKIKKKEVRTAEYSGRELMSVALVAPIYMNPQNKKEEENRRRKKKMAKETKQTPDEEKREMPENSTMIYYV